MTARWENWITDTVLYEGTLGIDEPQWFSLSIPEKNGEGCACL